MLLDWVFATVVAVEIAIRYEITEKDVVLLDTLNC